MPTQPAITITHNGVTITYSEVENKFVFELRGRERKVDSLREAREAIDKPAPKVKKPFEQTIGKMKHLEIPEEQELTI